MVFCWIEKEILSEFLLFWESQKFYFVESVCWVMLDPDRLQGKNVYSRAELDGREGIDISDAIVRKDSTLFKKSKKTLIMLRRDGNKKLELRH